MEILKNTHKPKYKLLLINPVNNRRKGLMQDKDAIYPPLALGIVAQITPSNWEVKIHDENFMPFEYKDADLVGFTSLTATINRCYEISQEYRKNGIPTVIGGIHASMLPEEASQYIDSVVIGEAEGIWEKLISDFEKNRLQKYYHAPLASISHSPSPKRELYHSDYFFDSMQTTRGCPMKCDFCSVHTFNGSKYRLRSVKDSLDDFAQIRKDLVYIVDDNFVGYSKAARNHAVEFFKGIVKRGIQKEWAGSASMNITDDEEILKYAAMSGCKLVFLGIESELVDQLENVNKQVNLKIGVDKFKTVYDKIHKYGISVMGAFIYGLENDTPEKIYNRTSYIINADIDIMQASILTPLPGTTLFKRFEQEERLLYTNFPKDWERYNYAEVVYKPHKMTPEEFQNSVYKNWERLYDLNHLKKKLMKTLKLTNNPLAASWAFASNLHLRNFVFEGSKEVLTKEEAFPQLYSGKMF